MKTMHGGIFSSNVRHGQRYDDDDVDKLETEITKYA